MVEAQKGRQAAEKSVIVGEDNGNKLNKITEMMEVANESKLNLKKEAEKSERKAQASARKAQALGASNRRKDNEIEKLKINLADAMGTQNEQGDKENRKNFNPPRSGKSAVVVKGADDPSRGTTLSIRRLRRRRRKPMPTRVTLYAARRFIILFGRSSLLGG